MIAIICGETHRFRPLVDLYKQADLLAGYKPEEVIVGMHSFGYVADNTKKRQMKCMKVIKLQRQAALRKIGISTCYKNTF